MIRYKPNKTLLPQQPADLNEIDFQWELDESIIAWDGGNGTSSAWRLVDGSLEYFMFPNVRVPVTGYGLNRDVTSIGVNEMVYTDVKNGRFAIGDGVWDQSKYPPETFVNSEERYGSEIHVFMLLCLLATLNAPEDTPLTIITSAPPGLVNKVAKTIKQNLRYGENKDKTGTWSIRMSYDKDWRNYVIGKVIVVPEGVGAFSAYAYDANGNAVLIPSSPTADDDLLTGQVHIHDAGLGTYDTYVVRDGKLDPESMALATDSDSGILRQIIEPIMDEIRNQFQRQGMSMPRLKPAQVDSWLRAWSMGGKKPKYGQVKISGKVLDLHPVFEALVERYADYLIGEKLEQSFGAGADTILLAGGGWEYVLPIILKRYSHRNILHPGTVSHLKNIPIWELNAYGALPMSAANKKVNRKVVG